ncbi:DEHA2F15070p [Debaryomyces hansenii CBS767]|jgi:uncharacterized protein YbjT (DUF2867 family)|uniref:Protein FMP52, mitochondrial n=1 Tax=Debaryomyces hansenii (strain ATCC 36239 / CBS 767 / BCRC 21394 / JCM 1990 / NBRC 0083 / IGC 2968) TaxID=284592 RepID=FMP52_DEBHA|nr:DEHA2F15070p [Debaryomyces hansenii CBS767]Q6BLA6.1 RecName: Full=Protein FMP52, mitochondrial; Flags: Precursor [Debaryomyces hansenii CBS767]CAG89385.1 DEHA2F15070p [Debaryomyces hansenii CBS767]|eukprot:XP_461015.1 DEHA2F15070p [Debaryomyces hansenii CBS767]
MSAFIIGSTGLVGAQLLKVAAESNKFETVHTVSRRPVDGRDKVQGVVETDTAKWPEVIRENSKGVRTFFSAFGTTRADAGGVENFKKIDYGINYECAKAAKEAGIETFVLVSSLGANESSMLFYLKSKGKLENDIIALEFPRTIIIRPGALLGKRQKSQGIANEIFQKWGNMVKGTPFKFTAYPITGEEVAKVAVHLASEPLTQGDGPVVKAVGTSELDHLVKSLE